MAEAEVEFDAYDEDIMQHYEAVQVSLTGQLQPCS